MVIKYNIFPLELILLAQGLGLYCTLYWIIALLFFFLYLSCFLNIKKELLMQIFVGGIPKVLSSKMVR